MSYVRTKEIPVGSGNYYSYRVHCERDGDTVRQVYEEYLGRAGGKGGGKERATKEARHRAAKIIKAIIEPAPKVEIPVKEAKKKIKPAKEVISITPPITEEIIVTKPVKTPVKAEKAPVETKPKKTGRAKYKAGEIAEALKEEAPKVKPKVKAVKPVSEITAGLEEADLIKEQQEKAQGIIPPTEEKPAKKPRTKKTTEPLKGEAKQGEVVTYKVAPQPIEKPAEVKPPEPISPAVPEIKEAAQPVVEIKPSKEIVIDWERKIPKRVRDYWDEKVENNPLRLAPKDTDAGAFIAKKIENAGDILREATKSPSDMGYIAQKINSIRVDLQVPDWKAKISDQELQALTETRKLINDIPTPDAKSAKIKELIQSVALKDTTKVGKLLNEVERSLKTETATPEKPKAEAKPTEEKPVVTPEVKPEPPKTTPVVEKPQEKIEPITPKVTPAKPSSAEVLKWKTLGFTKEDVDSLSSMSPKLRELHTHPARINGFNNVNNETTLDYIDKLRDLARENNDLESYDRASQVWNDITEGAFDATALDSTVDAEAILAAQHNIEIQQELKEIRESPLPQFGKVGIPNPKAKKISKPPVAEESKTVIEETPKPEVKIKGWTQEVIDTDILDINERKKSPLTPKVTPEVKPSVKEVEKPTEKPASNILHLTYTTTTPEGIEQWYNLLQDNKPVGKLKVVEKENAIYIKDVEVNKDSRHKGLAAQAINEISAVANKPVEKSSVLTTSGRGLQESINYQVAVVEKPAEKPAVSSSSDFKNYLIKKETDPLSKSGYKYSVYTEDGKPIDISGETSRQAEVNLRKVKAVRSVTLKDTIENMLL